MLKTCKHCVKFKVKQKVQKEMVAEKEIMPGYMLYLDLSKVTVKSGISKNVTLNQEN